MGGRAESTTLPCRAPQRKGIWWGRSIAGVLLDGLQTLWRLNNQPRRHKPKPRSGIRTRPEPFEPDMERTKQWLQADPQYNVKKLLKRLFELNPQRYGERHMRILQRRLRS